MRSMARPRGPLPARVYWVRRVLVLGVALALVFGIARLLGGTGDPAADSARVVGADSAPSDRITVSVDRRRRPRGGTRPRPRPGRQEAQAGEDQDPAGPADRPLCQLGRRGEAEAARDGARGQRRALPAQADHPGVAGLHLDGVPRVAGRQGHLRRRPDLVEPGLSRRRPTGRRRRPQGRAGQGGHGLARPALRQHVLASARLGAAGVLPRRGGGLRGRADRRAVRARAAGGADADREAQARQGRGKNNQRNEQRSDDRDDREQNPE